MKHVERAFHCVVVDWLQLALPPDAVMIHPANGELRTKKTAALLKRLGVVAGVPDLLVFWAGKTLAIELKAPGGRVQPSQVEMARRLQQAGVVTTICYSPEAVEQFLRWAGMPLRATLGGTHGKARLGSGEDRDASAVVR